MDWVPSVFFYQSSFMETTTRLILSKTIRDIVKDNVWIGPGRLRCFDDLGLFIFMLGFAIGWDKIALVPGW